MEKISFSNLFTDHVHLDSTLAALQDEGFSITGVMQGAGSFTASFAHSGLKECAFITCEDLSDPDSGTIKRGRHDLERAPDPVPLAAYATPIRH